MRDVEFDSARTCFGDHRGKALRLKVVEWIVGYVTVGEVRHDAPQPDRVGGRSALEFGQQGR